MKNIVIITFILMLSTLTYSDEMVTLKNGKKIVIKDNGTWVEDKSVATENKNVYEKIDNLNKIQALPQKWAGKKIQCVLSFSAITMSPTAMFSDSGFNFINVNCTDNDLELLSESRAGKEFVVKGVVNIDILGAAEINSEGISVKK